MAPDALLIRSNVINIADNACNLPKFEQYMYLKKGAVDCTKERMNLMIITFDLNGVDRKILVREISEITGKKAEYQFMPTCAYIIGSYTVNKDGTVSTANTDRTTLDTLIAALADRGFAKVSEEAEETEQEELVLDTEKTENDRFSISMSRDFFDDSTLSKLEMDLQHSKQRVSDFKVAILMEERRQERIERKLDKLKQ